jgi:hypothetical protein
MHEVKSIFSSEEEFKTWLQQEFPEPTDPLEKQAVELIGELLLCKEEDLTDEGDA